MAMSSTIRELLERGEQEAPAISAPGRRSLTYGELRHHVGSTVAVLNSLGVGRNDRMALVLPNGPEMACAFVAFAAGATTAPLNPAYREEEFGFYLAGLQPKLLVVPVGTRGPARAVARKRGIPVAELRPCAGSGAGLFALTGEPGPKPRLGGYAEPQDVALLLHTSGSTARPKMVPLTHLNLCTSAANVVKSLSLVPEDRCLNIMPLFHIHGLTAAVLGSLAAGASVCCTSGFSAVSFFARMKEANPTWYTAVPTMHQGILGRVRGNREVIDEGRLRLIRSSSASLPPQVMHALEDTFRVPVIEAYGMTEAAHQIASNPLPPRARKPGTVGVAAGPEVSIMDEEGRLLPPARIGEVVVRGPNLTTGYQGEPESTAAAFTDGWFRTGDQGSIDDEGYLQLTGRLKEIINRGGEKFSPLEVDEVLIGHPAVAQAVTFAVPHKKLGEDVAAALVLETGVAMTEREIRDYLRHRLADFKVPRRIIILEEIPKGPTGKLQRIGLAEKLGLP